MMRVDYAETLRRGDAYKRVNNAPIKMGRRQLMELFECKFRDSVSAGDIEVGFPGDIIHKDLAIPTCDLSKMPSALASNKLEELLNIRSMSGHSGSTTMVARLTHARLYGTEDPYVDRSPEDIMIELNQVRSKYRHQDYHFLFDDHAEKMQLVVYNQGEEPIIDASLSIALPNHNSFYVADELPKRPINGRFVDRTPDEISSYPAAHRSLCVALATVCGRRVERQALWHSLRVARAKPQGTGKGAAETQVYTGPPLTGRATTSTSRRVALYSARIAGRSRRGPNPRAAYCGARGANNL
jgi:hypothetical protein